MVAAVVFILYCVLYILHYLCTYLVTYNIIICPSLDVDRIDNYNQMIESPLEDYSKL